MQINNLFFTKYILTVTTIAILSGCSDDTRKDVIAVIDGKSDIKNTANKAEYMQELGEYIDIAIAHIQEYVDNMAQNDISYPRQIYIEELITDLQSGNLAAAEQKINDILAGGWVDDEQALNQAFIKAENAILAAKAAENNPVITVDNTGEVPVVTIPTNTPATFDGDTTGSVTEDTILTTTGTLDITDPDKNQESMQAGTYNGTFGSIVMDTAGEWTYTLNNNKATVQALNDGEPVTDLVTVRSLDGTAQIITLTVNGKNEVIADNPTDFSQLTIKQVGPKYKFDGIISDPDGIASVKIEYQNGNISSYTDGNINSESVYSSGTTYTITVKDDNGVVKTKTGIL